MSEPGALTAPTATRPPSETRPRGTVPGFVRTFWPWLAAVSTGVLLACAYPPVDRGGLIWFALAPLISAIWLGGTRRPALMGYVAGLVFFTLTFHWLGALGALFQIPILYALPLLLAAYLAMYPAVWCRFIARILVPPGEARRFPNSWRNLAVGITAASAWVLLEWVRGWLLGGFGWNSLGVALHKDLPTIQIAQLTGVAGLTWLVAFVNVMAVVIVRRIVAELGPVFLKKIRWEFSITVTLVVVVFAYGARVLIRSQSNGGTPVRIAAIQPNIPQEQKFDDVFEAEVLQQFERLTLPLGGFEPDLVLWPESSTPKGMFSDQVNFEFVQKIATELQAPLLLGTVINEPERGDFNGAALVSATDGELKLHGVYSKIRLVPFGEYLPLRPILNPIAGDLVPGDFDPGKDFTIFEGPRSTRFAALICFEDTDGDLARRFVKEGAHALINLTNDGWFLRTCGQEQHLANSVFRAVENRRPLVRCTNNGVTGLVHPTGQVDRWIQPHTQRGSIKSVSFVEDPLTFYTRYGEWLVWASLAPVVVAVALRFRAGRRQS